MEITFYKVTDQILFKSGKDMKDKEIPRNCHRFQETKKT